MTKNPDLTEFLENYNSSTCPWCRSKNTDFVDEDECSEKRKCGNCQNDYIVWYDNDIIADVTDRHSRPFKYTWKDLVCANDKVYACEFPISGVIDEIEDDDFAYQIDDFIEAAAREFNCSEDDIKTYTMDGEDFTDIEYDPKTLSFGAEDCGAYINGIAEWTIS